MRKILAVACAALLALLPIAPVSAASETGSQGWSRTVLTLHSGPGLQYNATGQIPGEVAIKILRCQKLWCVVDGPGGRGWTRIGDVAFGKTPYSYFDSRAPKRDYYGGEMCFYEGTNYTGRSFCAHTGQTFPDLALAGWDNRISSVRVITPTSAALCRDRFFQSYCERIATDTPVLSEYLSRNLTSVRVY